MARIAGVDLPRDKRIEIALTYIYGIGLTTSQRLLKETGINPDTRARDLTEDEVVKLRDIIDKQVIVEGDLRREQSLNIKRLVEIGCYRGRRHRMGLPVRGQNTKNNARTRKGPKKAVAGKNITEYPTCIIYRDDTEYKRYGNSVTWEELRNDINYLTGDEPTRQTNNIFVEAFIDKHDCITRAQCADAIAWMWKYHNTKVEYIQTNIDNPNKFAVIIRDNWRTYSTYIYSDTLNTEMIKNSLLRVPNTIKEAVKNNAIVL